MLPFNKSSFYATCMLHETVYYFQPKSDMVLGKTSSVDTRDKAKKVYSMADYFK